VRAEKARRHLLPFARHTAPADYRWDRHHEVLYRWIDEFAHGRRKRVIIEMPPRHGKSEATSRRLPAYLFGRLPKSHLAMACHTAGLAQDMSRDVRQIMETPAYRGLFPGAGIARAKRDRDRADLFDVAGGGSFKAVGVGGALSGRGFTHGIIDDYCKDRQDANSLAHREHVWRWYTSVFHTRQAKGAGILITATRWHEDDLIGRLKEKVAAGESEPFDVLTLPALATDAPHPDDWRQPGEPLWPWFRTAAEWEQRRLLEPRDFAALDQQDPRAEGGTEWGAACFPPSVWFDDWPADRIQVMTVGLDPSKGKDVKSGDYSALVALARDNAGTLWVEADLARRPVPRIVTDGIEFCRRLEAETGRPLDGFGCESDQFQELLADEFYRQTRAAGFPLNVFKLTTQNVPKEVRILRLSADIVRRNVRFRNTPGTRLLVRQLQDFPNAEFDDGPDAMEYARRLAAWLWNKPRKK
jgi:predicted phage terminase large subunit-like protein